MKPIILDWSTIHDHGSAWYSHHELRKRVFVDGSDWDIPTDRHIEWDQYDCGNTVYSIVLDDTGKCVACARMNPTTGQNGIYSYMIKDAQRSLLTGIPSCLLAGPAPVCRSLWEGTRYATDPSLSRQESQMAQIAVIDGMIAYAQANCIVGFLGLMPVAVYRLLRRLGYHIVEFGNQVEIDGRLTRVALMSVPEQRFPRSS